VSGCARDRLARIFGPDLLELLGTFVGERVEEVLAHRESERRWLTPEEAAAYLGISASAVRMRIARGSLRYSRIGRRLLVDRHALDVELERELR
jgi:excisionase family DNA binding protein